MATRPEKLPSGNWRVRVQTFDENGKRHYQSVTADTKSEAAFLAAQIEQNGSHSKAPSTLTLSVAITEYINARTAVLSPSTIRGYHVILDNSVKSLMPRLVSAISCTDIQRAINEDALTHSPKTIRNIFGLLTAVLSEVRPELQMSRINLPQAVKHDMEIPEDNDVHRLIEAARGTKLHSAILLGAFGGLRRSEIAALTKEDVNPKTNEVSITRAMVANNDKKWVIKTTKSYAGTRVISLPRPVINSLLENANAPYLVGLTPSGISCAFIRLRNSLDMPAVRFHDLRHYTASIMLALGVPDKYAMEIMGHSTSGMLKRVYQHTMHSKRDAVRKIVTEYFEKQGV